MIFLVEYNRSAGKLVTLRTFRTDASAVARDARSELELVLHRKGIDHEVVLLEAASEAALRETHGRYFWTLGHSSAELERDPTSPKT